MASTEQEVPAAASAEAREVPPDNKVPRTATDLSLVEEQGDENGNERASPIEVEKKKKRKKKVQKAVQSDPPRVGLSKLFPNNVYPEGQIQEYKDDNHYRTTSEEKRYVERQINQDPEHTYNSIRRAAEVHRQVREYARRWVRPGMTMTEIANGIEDSTRALVEEKGMESGIGFPTGLSLNDCAAHYTPNAGDKIVLKSGDILKVDIGVQVKGRICDSAFTLSWNPDYENLLTAVKDATNTGIREAGIDVRLGEIGGYIQETMESYEVTIGTNTLPIKSIENLTGHTIGLYQIHGGKSVPIVKTGDRTKMEEGEYFAIETFGSTGRGHVVESGEVSHYAKILGGPKPRRDAPASAKKVLSAINKHFGTLPFCRRYLDRAGETSYLYGLQKLVQEGIVQDYPPLKDQPGSMTAQFEHTILLRPTVKEVVSRGTDY
ncbi:peptidase M24, structural domain-containing protein [Cantharellus anzutake]|uniref:peptidase M24, structural domain-containing protein n=1 Tax=Cantharellus anzutake TaxID=1750568 RepID=UPI0019059F1D|nr:peptidase M24, structural domain-containing protein [Cantharellus anzutake]KAF8333047.1 peptidase M24, structural domain-containing protein [Cantharellus anzutake]